MGSSGVHFKGRDSPSGVHFELMDCPTGVYFKQRDSPSGVHFKRRDSPSGVHFKWRDSPSGCILNKGTVSPFNLFQKIYIIAIVKAKQNQQDTREFTLKVIFSANSHFSENLVKVSK